ASEWRASRTGRQSGRCAVPIDADVAEPPALCAGHIAPGCRVDCWRWSDRDALDLQTTLATDVERGVIAMLQHELFVPGWPPQKHAPTALWTGPLLSTRLCLPAEDHLVCLRHGCATPSGCLRPPSSGAANLASRTTPIHPCHAVGVGLSYWLCKPCGLTMSVPCDHHPRPTPGHSRLRGRERRFESCRGTLPGH